MYKKITFFLFCIITLQQPTLHAGIFSSFFDGVGKGAGKEIGKTVSQTVLGPNKDRIILALLVVGGLLLVRYIYLSDQQKTRKLRIKKSGSRFREPSLSNRIAISSCAATHCCEQKQ
jgi:hypothetical protein